MTMDRLDMLPTRALVLSETVMEFAYSDGTVILLVTYVPRAGAPDDPTKLQFDVGLDVLDEHGATISPATRTEIHVVYNDPVAIGTTDTPAAQILANVAAICARSIAWAHTLIDPTPLHEQLAPPAVPAPPATPATT